MGRSPSHPGVSVPDRIGRYEVLLPIGSGGMGTVYLARRHGVGGFRREVALKVMHAHLRSASDFSSALIEEAKIAGRIRHPNVVPVLDVGVDSSGVYLVMDYVEGDSLSGLQRVAKAMKTALPIRVGLRVIVDCLAGLHAAHELRDEGGRSLGLIHRDFSPQNLLVGVDGMSRLTDFGVAKARTNLEQTGVGLLKGKVRYMAPEQIRCDPIDRRCDVWAAGVVVWELLSGRRLYAQKPEAQAMLEMVSKPPPRLRTLHSDLPEELDRVVHTALQIEVAKRCPTAKELADRLVKAARKVDWLADRDEVAEFVSGVVGAKLATRRQQVSEVRRLREEITAIRSSAVVPESGSGSSDSAPVPAVDAEDVTTVRVSVDGEAEGEQTETTRRLPRQARTPTPSLLAREDTTDIHSVADARRLPAHSLGRLVPSLVVAMALLAGFAVVRECTRTAGPDTVVAEGTFSEPAPATRPDRDEGEEAKPAATAEAAVRSDNPTLTVQANAPVRVLKIGQREFEFDAPTAEVAVPLTADEHQSYVQVEAISADKRKASAKLAPGDTDLELRFPQRSAPPPPTATPPRPSRPPARPPLATNPYLKKGR